MDILNVLGLRRMELYRISAPAYRRINILFLMDRADRRISIILASYSVMNGNVLGRNVTMIT